MIDASVEAEIVRALVVAVGFLLQLHQDVVGKAAGAEAEADRLGLLDALVHIMW
ncbi:MAG TPA: hypothetical protein PLB89_00485 [Flavobacteriales bacterium]|nr:hypothetical protein [Flavobacteriales bacterium]